MLKSGVLSMSSIACAAVGRADHLHLLVLEQRGQREDVARVVVDHQHLAAAQHFVGAVQPLEHRLLLRRQVGDDAVQEQRRLVEQPLGRLHVLQDDALGHRLELRLLVGGQLLAGEDDHGHVGQRRLGVHLLEQLEAGHVGQAQVEHHAVERLVAHRRRAPRSPVPTATISMSSWPSSSTIDCALDVVVLDDQQPLGARRGEVLDAVEGGLEAVGGRRLDQVGEGAVRQAVLALFLQRDDLHRDVARAPDRA